MRKVTLNILLIGAVITGSILVNACSKGYRINTKKMIQDEKTLMEDFVLEQDDSISGIKDSIMSVLEQDGMVYFETQEGTGDSVKSGKQVGFRYTYYKVVRDTLGVPFLYPWESNYSSESPRIYTVGNTNVYNGGVYQGWDMALQRMAYGTKARAYIFSSLWSNDYVPKVIDLEVTYVEK